MQQRQLHELCVSPEVIRELSDHSFQNRNEALALTVDCLHLPATDDVRGLAKILVGEKAMPGPAEEGDAMHVAVAVVHRCDYLLTWNVKHLANLRKTTHLRNLCRRAGYALPDIVTPEYLWSLDDEG